MYKNPHKRARVIAAVLSLALVMGACAGDSEVGTGLEVGADGDGGDGGVRDTTTTTTVETTTTTEAPSSGPAETTTTTAGTTTTMAPLVVNVIEINDDAKGFYFSPDSLQVPEGQIVRWTNTDTRPRGILFGDQSVNSGDIAPGAFFDWVANRKGDFTYGDPTRPYTEGQGFLQVY